MYEPNRHLRNAWWELGPHAPWETTPNRPKGAKHTHSFGWALKTGSQNAGSARASYFGPAPFKCGHAPGQARRTRRRVRRAGRRASSSSPLESKSNLGLDLLRIRTPLVLIRGQSLQKLHSEKAVLFKCLPSPGRKPAYRILARTKIHLVQKCGSKPKAGLAFGQKTHDLHLLGLPDVSSMGSKRIAVDRPDHPLRQLHRSEV